MMIKLIVGLGNPTAQYEQTRHNAGFWFVDELATQWQTAWRDEKKFHGELARHRYADRDIFLLKPNTYMNLSGKSVAAVAQFYKIQPHEILVAHDELDIPCGKIRFKLGGGNGGHNGLKDIQAKIGTADFYRLRLGIGHPGDKNLVAGYVLTQPSPTERTLLSASIRQSLLSLPDILDNQTEKAVRALHGFQAA